MRPNQLNTNFLKSYRRYKMLDMDFNCWGGVVMYFTPDHKQKKLWFTQPRMNTWLKNKCSQVRKLEPNTIICIYRNTDNELMHSMVYLGNNKVWHKLGAGIAEVTTLEKVLKEYAFDIDEIPTNKLRYFRFNK